MFLGDDEGCEQHFSTKTVLSLFEKFNLNWSITSTVSATEETGLTFEACYTFQEKETKQGCYTKYKQI